MNQLIARNQLYIILCAIEADLRRHVSALLEEYGAERDLLTPQLRQKASERLRKEQGSAEVEPKAETLVPYLDLADYFELLNRHRELLPKAAANYFRDVTPQLQKLVPIRNKVMHGRPLDFDDFPTGRDTAQEFSNSTHWPELVATLKRLSDEPAFVLGVEIPVIDADRISHNLPTPEFDDTGFLGRDELVRQVTKLCIGGTWPVITLLGDGGVGKTALALKVAYDILDLPGAPYEAIVWASSKTTRLTETEIVQIREAICDSLGILRHVGEQLVGSPPADPMQEVLDYLGKVPILLVLDNLETVLDEIVRGFLSQLPRGTTVLITSRIALGAYDYPVRLTPMNASDAVRLLRTVARVRGLDQLAKLPTRTLGTYCDRMNNSPGFIKWFVAAVQSGRRPEEVLARPEVFLDFCMSNVYNYLSEQSRGVLSCLLWLPESHSQAELSHFSDLDPPEMQTVLAELLTTNMVSMSSEPRGSSFESRYQLNDLARAYLEKHHPVALEETRRLTKKRDEFRRMVAGLSDERKRDPYSIRTVEVRSTSELVVARYLRGAIERAQEGRLPEAEDQLEKGELLAPDYHEVHRVAGFVRAERGNLLAARTSFETAVSLAPASAPLRFWYGRFLCQRMKDLDAGIDQLRIARELDPNGFEPALEFAYANLRAGRFDDVETTLEALDGGPGMSISEQRRLRDIQLMYFRLRADALLKQRDAPAAVYCLRQLKKTYTSIAPEVITDRMRDTISRSLSTARRAHRSLVDAASRQSCQQFIDWAEQVTASTTRLQTARTSR